jgi:ribonuclease Z
VVDGFRAAYALEDSYRVAHHGEHWSSAGASAAVTEAQPGVVWDQGGLKVTMFDVEHQPVVPAVGYRFDYNGRSVVVSGDTKKAASVIEMSRGADLLVHEAVDRQTIDQALQMMQRAQPRRAAMTADMMSHHTTTLELAEIARDAGVKKLAITHLVPSIPPTDAAEANFVRGMKEIYSGPIVVGRDGLVIRIE